MLKIGLVSRTPDNLYGDMVLALCKANVDFIICGGVAAIIHGVPRNTFDLDIALRMDKDNVRRFLQCIKELGLAPRVAAAPETLLRPHLLPSVAEEKGAVVFAFTDPNDPLRNIDVFLTKKLSFETLLPEVEKHEFAGYSVQVITAKQLLKLKMDISPVRQKDWLDIQHLDKMLRDRHED
jgi:hypothetical protein